MKKISRYHGVSAAEKYLKSKSIMAFWQLRKMRNRSLMELAVRRETRS